MCAPAATPLSRAPARASTPAAAYVRSPSPAARAITPQTAPSHQTWPAASAPPTSDDKYIVFSPCHPFLPPGYDRSPTGKSSLRPKPAGSPIFSPVPYQPSSKPYPFHPHTQTLCPGLSSSRSTSKLVRSALPVAHHSYRRLWHKFSHSKISNLMSTPNCFSLLRVITITCVQNPPINR